MKWKRLLAGALAATVAIALLVHALRTRVQVGGPDAHAPRVAVADVDHSLFDDLLQRYVDEGGLVAYARWQASPSDRQALDDYLKRLGSANLDLESSRGARLAYWINAYNALTIQGILREYPTSSIRNHTPLFGGYNIWKDLLLRVDGRDFSLDAIEHGLLRKMDEPRIHFGVVCAAKGCPPLRQRAYTTAGIEDELSDNARRFFASTDKFQADPDSRSVYISELLKWYGTDFAPKNPGLLRTLRPYFPNPDKLAWIEQDDVTLEYLPYDWALNDQPK